MPRGDKVMLKQLSTIVCAIVIVLNINICRADETAITGSGQKVILKDDGTWSGANDSVKTPPADGSYSNSGEVINSHCITEWVDDFSMRSYCIKKQKAAVASLLMGKPADISPNQFVSVRQHCESEWPKDFVMRQYCEKKQFAAIRELKQ
jgi:hypothetical protein